MGVGFGFVLESRQVQDPVNHHAPKLILKHNTLIFRVFKNPFEGDQEVSGKGVAFGLVEGDDVGVGVVIEVLAVVSKELFI